MNNHIQQRSPEWHAMRRGKITASRFKDVMYGSEKAWTSYMRTLDEGERQFTSEATQWGTDKESEALAYFELLHKQSTMSVGFVIHPEHPMVGGSPDFLLGDDGGGEIKCPFNEANHQQILISQQVPNKYMPQIQGNLWVTGRQYWWFISYDPRCKGARDKIFTLRVERDESFIQKLKKRVLQFWDCYSSTRDIASCFDMNLSNSTSDIF